MGCHESRLQNQYKDYKQDILESFLIFFNPGKLWSRSLKLAYTLLNKLGTKTEPVLQPGDRVRVLPLTTQHIVKF